MAAVLAACMAGHSAGQSVPPETQPAASAETDAVLSSIERQNEESARELVRVKEETRVARLRMEEQAQRLAELKRALAADQQRVKLSGSAGGPVSAVLLRHQGELDTPREVQRDMARAQRQSADVEIKRLDLADQIAALRDTRDAAEELLRDPRRQGSASEVEVAAALEIRKRDFLVPLVGGLTELATALADRVDVQAQLATVTAEYRQFIDAQVVWLPNDAPIGMADAGRSLRDASVLVSAGYWQEMLAGARASIREFPLRWLLYTAVLGLIVAYRGRFLARVRELGQSVGTPGDRFLNSVQCLMLTLLCAAPVPAALGLYGTLLMETPEPGPNVLGFAGAMDSIAGLVLICTVLLELARPEGLAEAHFGWPPSVLKSLRAGTRVTANAAVPLLFVSSLALGVSGHDGASSLGRLALIASLLVVGIVSVRMFNPSTGLFARVITQRPRGWVAVLRGLWYPALVAVPFVMAVGAAMGYVFTTLIILNNMVETYWVILAIAVALAMLERLFQSTSERFAWRRGTSTAEQRRLGEQVGRVIRLTTLLFLLVGIAVAWSDVVPALGLMNSSTLWTVAGENNSVKSVTLRDLLVFALVIVLTVQLVRDLPGVLGLALLQRFPLDDSARYAIVSLGRYVLVLGGMVAAFWSLKIGWTNVQWLAAAATVGLGFGLQEIFANFVSGLIMLAERPVRIGDVVTVDNVSGRVVKIATRATTLVDGDEKEVIIPNKQFITQRITNWTLDNGPIRYAVTVGVDYGTDLKLAEETLRGALGTLPLVVKDPGPGVALRDFGESSINIDVWYYVAAPVDHVPTRHALIMEIDRVFRERGIGIAFPQIDVHLRDVPGGLGALKVQA